MMWLRRLRYFREHISAWLDLAWFLLSSSISRRVLAVGCGTASACILSFATGYYTAEYSHRYTAGALEDFMQIAGIEWQESDSWDMRFAMIKQKINIADEKTAQLESMLQDSLITIEELKEEVYFYKSVIAPEELVEGIVIFSTAVEMAAKPGEYPVEVVLRKTGKTNQVMKGHIEISISATMDHEQKEVTGLIGKTMDFSFRYFQRVKGILILQHGFIPERLTVTVFSKHFLPIVETYSWSEVAADLLPGS